MKFFTLLFIFLALLVLTNGQYATFDIWNSDSNCGGNRDSETSILLNSCIVDPITGASIMAGCAGDVATVNVFLNNNCVAPANSTLMLTVDQCGLSFQNGTASATLQDCGGNLASESSVSIDFWSNSNCSPEDQPPSRINFDNDGGCRNNPEDLSSTSFTCNGDSEIQIDVFINMNCQGDQIGQLTAPTDTCTSDGGSGSLMYQCGSANLLKVTLSFILVTLFFFF